MTQMEKKSKLSHNKTIRETITAPLQKSMLQDHLVYENLKRARAEISWRSSRVKLKRHSRQTKSAHPWHLVLKWKSRGRVIFLR